ncbi:polyamine oxidase [Lachancea thermotolerans CBS 6340]|uniref:KLTH0D07942p n=1 Tax=Lachancea thermotolerans (strain ATCC 56472 / CBS 6340 / NRRL Y-8284) TaxID=559295 RepID=C5DGS8_LACTC|nr:KLTH0D07942p [Lachancea thermotolerans CBS 6340]CAR22620.1 KLTH0D07942p [Lachancea thermotolerans CBS 6340]
MIENQVVIIGAGIAGLKAASELYKRGFKSCTILEARDRIGGRLHTVTGYQNRRYDLGASWHHDTLVNGLFLEELNLPEDQRASFVFDDDSMVVFDAEKGRVDQDPEMVLEILLEELVKYSQLHFFEDLSAQDLNYFQMVVKYLYERRGLLTNDQIRFLPQVARFMELWHGIDWKSQSSKCLEIAHQGRNALVLNYDKIVRRIASEIPESWLQLSTEVKEVRNDGKNVLVTIDKGETISCKYVIVTVPQSILAHSLQPEPRVGKIEFIPPLNVNIQDAFKKTHYGALGKVVFEFDDCCWSTERSRILSLGKSSSNLSQRVREARDLSLLVEELDANTKYQFERGDSWNFPLLFVNMVKHTGIPSFVMLMANPLTKYIESMNDKGKIFEFFTPVLENLLKTLGCAEPIVKDFENKLVKSNKKAPILKNIVTTNWTRDDYALGAYSACEPGDDPMDLVLALTENQTSLVRFAGEHTIMDGAGCVYGAWQSGKREADFIADKLA